MFAALAGGGLLFGNAIIQGSAGIKQVLRHMGKSHVNTPHGNSGHNTPKHDIPEHKSELKADKVDTDASGGNHGANTGEAKQHMSEINRLRQNENCGIVL